MTSDPRHGMFLLQGERLVGLDETPYESEPLLQKFLADYPDLLAGHQVDPRTPRRWVLVKREAEIPDALDAAGRWSLDHLFLDQDGVPTLVEVKRSSDTRIRREVVGQMLDYAANAVAYVPVDKIRSSFERTCGAAGREPADVLGDAFGEHVEPESYWSQVGDNLAKRRLRLLFVADSIPDELLRVVEYLNEQMRTTEVLAIELKQYRGGDLVTLVPRVLGRTAEAEQVKATSSGPNPSWTWERLSRAMAEQAEPIALERAKALLAWAEKRLRVWWGRGSQSGGFVAVYDKTVREHYTLFEIWDDGTIEVGFRYLKSKGPFAEEALREELRNRINALCGTAIAPSAIGGGPRVKLAAFSDRASFDRLLQTWEWVLETLAAAPAAQ